MDDQIALKMESPTNITSDATSVNSGIILPKNSKENRYYYKHREEILEKMKEKRMQNPEYKAKMEEREKKKAEKELLRAQKEEKRRIMAEMVSKKL